MSLFDLSTALSCELPAANQLADRLADTDAIQSLAETDGAEVARTKLTVGIAGDPFDGDTYSLGELENQHFFGQVYAESEEGHVVGLSSDAMGTPRDGGVYCVYLRRQVRESEERADAYNFFWDRISAIGTTILAAAEEDLEYPRNYRFRQVGRTRGPEFGRRRGESDQGVYLYALLKFTWGDVEV